jgi:hypothetical protein
LFGGVFSPDRWHQEVAARRARIAAEGRRALLSAGADVRTSPERTGYRPVESLGLRSWIEPELTERLSRLLRTIDASIVLISDWRRDRDLAHLADELRSAGIDGRLPGARCGALA